MSSLRATLGLEGFAHCSEPCPAAERIYKGANAMFIILFHSITFYDMAHFALLKLVSLSLNLVVKMSLEDLVSSME